MAQKEAIITKFEDKIDAIEIFGKNWLDGAIFFKNEFNNLNELIKGS